MKDGAPFERFMHTNCGPLIENDMLRASINFLLVSIERDDIPEEHCAMALLGQLQDRLDNL